MSNQTLSPEQAWSIWGLTANLRKIGDFGTFRCKITRLPPPLKTLSHCINSVWDSPYSERRTTPSSAAKGNIPTISSFQDRSCLDRAIFSRPWRDPRHRCIYGQKHARRARGVDRRGSGRGRLRSFHLRAATEEP